MALVNGQRSLEEICNLSSLDRNETLVKLAQLKLAGIITQTEKKAATPTAPSAELTVMVNRLSELFEDYLTRKESRLDRGREVTRTFVEETN